MTKKIKQHRLIWISFAFGILSFAKGYQAKGMQFLFGKSVTQTLDEVENTTLAVREEVIPGVQKNLERFGRGADTLIPKLEEATDSAIKALKMFIFLLQLTCALSGLLLSEKYILPIMTRLARYVARFIKPSLRYEVASDADG